MPVSLLTSNPTTKQIARAERFVNAEDSDIARLTNIQYRIENGASDKKFAKGMNAALYSLPLVSFVSKFATSKKIGPAAKAGASWGMALVSPIVVCGANKLLTKNESIRKFEDNHPTLTFLTGCAASVSGMFAGTALLERKGVQNFVEKNYNRIADAVRNIKNPIKPETMKKITGFTSKIKMPEFVKNAAKAVKDTGFYKAVTPKLADAGKFALKYAPEIAATALFGALIVDGISKAHKYNTINNEIKDVQFNTAKDLANYYKEENNNLKTATTQEVPADDSAQNIEENA